MLLKRIMMSVSFLLAASACSEEASNGDVSQTCPEAKSQIENFMSQNRSCNSDSDCNSEFGGCLVLVFNNSTDRNELYRLKSSYDSACSGQGVCGIPPGIAKCENQVCKSAPWP
jgi:hypothetical protein